MDTFLAGASVVRGSDVGRWPMPGAAAAGVAGALLVRGRRARRRGARRGHRE